MKIYKIRKAFFITIIILLVIVIVLMTMVETSSYKARYEINEFIKRGELVFEDNNTRYYKVTKKYDYEDASNVIEAYSDLYIGTTGDIYLTCTDWGSSVITSYICKRLYVGHGGIVSKTDGSMLYEIVGNSTKSENIVKEYDNDWYSLKHFSVELVLRVKNVDSTKQDALVAYLKDIDGSYYNPIYFMHPKDKYYCTDLLTRAYSSSIGVNISKSMITTGASMIQNDNTYLIYYKKEINDGNFKYEVYFLGEE